MDLFKDYFGSLSDLYTKSNELSAIWLSKPVNTSIGRTVRIAPDMMVCVENNELKETGELNCKVIGCYGTLIDQFEISVMELENNNLQMVKL